MINSAPSNCIGGPIPNEGATSLCAPPGSQTIVGNLISGNTTYGIQITNADATGNVVQANKIGTNIDGTIADPDSVPNTGDELGNRFDGVFLGAGAHHNTIGGTTPNKRNVISGNIGDGVVINGESGNPAHDNDIIGNYIGTDVTGTAALANRARGVHIDQHSANNTIGGDSGSGRNIISGNGADGVIIALASAENNVVRGNFIGTDKNGNAKLGNAGAGKPHRHANLAGTAPSQLPGKRDLGQHGVRDQD